MSVYLFVSSVLGLLLTYSALAVATFGGNLACDVLFRMRAQDYTFCLLIVRYMLSDKIKGKSALKARTVLHVVRDKVHACYWYWLSVENSAGYLQCVQIFLNPSLAKFSGANLLINTKI